MSDEEQAFLRAICERPHDDTPRLVYTDWLEERGVHPDDKAGDVWRIRQAIKNPNEKHTQLYRFDMPHNEGFTATVHSWRGFGQWIELAEAELLRHAAVLFSRMPITSVYLTDKHPDSTHGAYRWYNSKYHLLPEKVVRSAWHRKQARVARFYGINPYGLTPRQLAELAAQIGPLHSEELLRERWDDLTAKGVKHHVLEATGDEVLADDLYVKKVEEVMLRGDMPN